MPFDPNEALKNVFAQRAAQQGPVNPLEGTTGKQLKNFAIEQKMPDANRFSKFIARSTGTLPGTPQRKQQILEMAKQFNNVAQTSPTEAGQRFAQNQADSIEGALLANAQENPGVSRGGLNPESQLALSQLEQQDQVTQARQRASEEEARAKSLEARQKLSGKLHELVFKETENAKKLFDSGEREDANVNFDQLAKRMSLIYGADDDLIKEVIDVHRPTVKLNTNTSATQQTPATEAESSGLIPTETDKQIAIGGAADLKARQEKNESFLGMMADVAGRRVIQSGGKHLFDSVRRKPSELHRFKDHILPINEGLIPRGNTPSVGDFDISDLGGIPTTGRISSGGSKPDALEELIRKKARGK